MSGDQRVSPQPDGRVTVMLGNYTLIADILVYLFNTLQPLCYIVQDVFAGRSLLLGNSCI